jgi:2-amino-4-hydroxy-6-hydroxymethyldihydropteridine diphosphokinase
MTATRARAPTVRACVGLGANLGDAAGTVRAALSRLAALPDTRLLAASRLYRTPAWGMTAQPDFVNAVAVFDTMLGAAELLDELLTLERAFGRRRANDGSDRWGPRRLDLDMLLYGVAQIDAPGLRVPHPQMYRRAFVLVPLLEIAPEIAIPGIGPARAALDALPAEEAAQVVALEVDAGPDAMVIDALALDDARSDEI